MTTVRRELEDLLASHAAETALLGDAELLALLPVLDQARAELNRDLSAWIAAGKGTDRYTPQAYRSSLLGIESALGVVRERVGPALLRALIGGDEIARRLANGQTGAELALFARAGFSGVLPDVPVRVASGLVTSRNAPMRRYETSAERYAGRIGDDIRRELAVGVVRGESLDQLVARLQGIRGPRGLVALRGVVGRPGAVTEVIPEGLFRRYEYWAERIVRTELAYAHNEQLQDIATDLRGTTHMTDMTRRWDASSDGRLCPRCQDMHGAVADPRTDMFPNDVVGPPLHPNCRCRAGLWRPGWERFMDRNYRDPGGPDPVIPTAVINATTTAPAPAPRPAAPAPAPPVPAAPAAPPAPATAAVTQVLTPPGRAVVTNDLAAIATPAERVAALGVDAGVMADALTVVPEVVDAVYSIAATPGQLAAMGTVRNGLREMLSRWAGLVTGDKGSTGNSRGGMGFWISRKLKATGARAAHYFSGVVQIDPDVCKAAQQAFAKIAQRAAAAVTQEEWSALRTLFHEEIHGCSPLLGAAATRHGIVWEEVLTDVLARKAVRDISGLAEGLIDSTSYGFGRWSKNALGYWRGNGAVQGSYATIIERAVAAVSAELRLTPQEAVSLLERVAVRQRRGTAKQFQTADGYVRDLARRILVEHHGAGNVHPSEVRSFASMMSSTRFSSTSGHVP